MPRRKQDRPKRMKWEDGEEGKGGKNPEDASDSVSVDGDDAEDRQLDNNSNSTHSSRSSTPELPPPASPVLLPPPPPPPPLITKDEHEMELMNKNSSAMMDISRNAVANPELIQAADDDDDDGDEDMSSSVATQDDTPLDFSVKRGTEDESTDDDRSVTPNGLNPPSISQDGALDLSVPRSRSSRSGGHLENPKHAKMAKLESALAIPSSPWGYNAPKHLPKAMVKATVVEVPMWNGKVKSEKRDKSYHSASSSKHSSLNRSNAYNPLMHKNASPPLDSMKASGKSGSKNDPYRPAGRQNPWQSQWMSRSSEQTRDVFTCVWCKEAFRSLAEMTVHMKQSPRCGMAGMQNTLPSVSPTSTSAINHQSNMHQSPLPVKCSSSSTSAGPAANAVIKENVSLPRKLVRGQDVWLGKGAEQTRQILKCMWCGQSFKTLADMTTHMRVTQHYTNIISQEQIISWRTPEDKMAAQSQVNAVLTCKVCDQAFGSLKELSYHMVKNSHYKEHILRSITEGGGRRRQTRERRKKSLPVRKLLELERLELNKQNPSSSNDLINQAKNEVVDGKISCEECTEKVDAKDFVQHIKNCTQGSRSQHSVKSSPGSEGAKSTNADNNLDTPTTSGAIPSSSPLSSQELPSEDGNTPSKGQILHQEDSLCDSVESTGSTSVLNAIEKLIEKSFESKGRRNAVSTGILQRLGIDEEVYPPWHPSSSPSAFGALRSSLDFQRKSTSPLARMHDFKMEMADFSGSESRSRSSSTSEKHHSFDEQLRLSFGLSAKDIMNRVSTPSSASQSCSPVNFQPESPADDRNAVFLTKEATNSNMASTSQAAACSVSPKARSVTPSSDRDNTEKISAKENEQQEEAKDTRETDTSEKIKVKSEEKTSFSDEEKPMDCSSVTSPKSEERRTPRSRSSSCEPDAALPSSPLAERVKEECSPSKHSRHIPKKKRNSEIHRKSPSSNKRRSHSHRKRDADASVNDGCDSVLGSPMSAHSVDLTSPRQKQHNDSTASDHPLKELQKLLDKTDAHLSRPNLPATPGSILAFSWACSEATTSDSLMKCAFCDTHFISKGAYRHHLSKMHFVKDGSLAEIAAASTWKPPTTSSGNSKTPPVGGNNSNGCAGSGSIASGGGRARNNSSDTGHPSSPPKEHLPPAPSDESPHSKFLKYTELAKQLSSKYV